MLEREETSQRVGKRGHGSECKPYTLQFGESKMTVVL